MPIPTTHSRHLFVLAVIAALAAALLGCSGSESDAEEGGTQTGIDRSELLGDLGEVRDLFAQRSPLDAELLADVSYSDGELTVTLADDAGGVGQAEQVCNDLGDAIQLPDLSINVEGPDGAPLATCTFAGAGS